MRLTTFSGRSPRYSLKFTLANFVRCRRLHHQMSIMQAAEAGISFAEWNAIEDGYRDGPCGNAAASTTGAVTANATLS